MNKSRWSCSGCSRRGASHFRSGLPNQDAIYWTPDPHTPLVMAVSDGHGSPKNFRSEQGSQIAVQVAVDMLLRSYHSFRGDGMLSSDIERWLKQSLAKRLVESWQSAVNAHWQANPFTEAEWARLLKGNSHGARKSIESNPILAYGATLLAVLVTDQFVFCLQLGDGDILSVSVTGETTRPLANDERLMANETTSLCMKNAWEECRVEIVEYELEDFPALILLSTDGYSNSFTSEPDFLKIGSDYLNMIKESGLSQVIEQLPSFLDYASQNGSGDDITLGIIYQNQQDNQIYIDLEETPLKPQKIATRRVKKNRNSGKSKLICFVGIFLLLCFSIAFIAKWFEERKIFSALNEVSNGLTQKFLKKEEFISTKNTVVSRSQNCSVVVRPLAIKPQESIKIEVVINEIENIVSENKGAPCIRLQMNSGEENIKLFFSKGTQPNSVVEKFVTDGPAFIAYVKEQTGYSGLQIYKDNQGVDNHKSNSNQSYFYFSPPINGLKNSQTPPPLKGYSYFSNKGWIVTLISPQDSFRTLFGKEFVNSDNYISSTFLESLEKSSNPKKTRAKV